jgi:hypothetical protein
VCSLPADSTASGFVSTLHGTLGEMFGKKNAVYLVDITNKCEQAN